MTTRALSRRRHGLREEMEEEGGETSSRRVSGGTTVLKSSMMIEGRISAHVSGPWAGRGASKQDDMIIRTQGLFGDAAVRIGGVGGRPQGRHAFARASGCWTADGWGCPRPEAALEHQGAGQRGPRGGCDRTVSGCV